VESNYVYSLITQTLILIETPLIWILLYRCS